MARGREQGGFFDIFAVFKKITENQLPHLISNPRRSKVCRHCDKALLTNQEEHGFCSHPCAADKWEIFRLGSSGTNICKMPGCSKPCYTDKTRKHDFCGKTHANSYKTMLEEFEKEKARKKRIAHFSHSDSSQGSGIIRFYNRDAPYYEFTNFYHAPIELDGKLWPTTEHYFQAQKFVGTPFSEVIRAFQNPREAFDCARRPTVSYWLRNDWEKVKVDIMRKALLAKFTQHERLRKLLLSTRDNILIEHSPYDSFWGNGEDGRGDNKLGLLLMEIRHDFRERKKAGSDSSAAKAAVSSQESFTGSRIDSLTRPPLYGNPPQLTEGNKTSSIPKHVPVVYDLVNLNDSASHDSTNLQTPVQETQGPDYPHYGSKPLSTWI